ncbi:MAG TPA: MBL fold metallo-hydrolase [Polyangiales bacterium]|nr:MBL fold metallo-hydrolase [Polyangiales bacterium]
MTAHDLYFRQVLVGPMQNFIYFLGSHTTRECLIVDPAWDTQALLDLAAKDGMTVIGSLVTHYHPDHVGGGMGSFRVPGGVAELLGKVGGHIHVNKHEADGLKKITGVSESDLVRHEAGDVVEIGDVAISLIHTPGHTPGSQCFLVRNRLVAGDTLFIDACGRVDLPGGDAEQMQESLRTLAKLPDDVVLHPGHDYGSTPTATIAEQRQTNPYIRRALAQR